MQTLTRVIERLRNTQGVAVQAGASGECIANFETAIGQRLPNEFKQFYLTCDGIGFSDLASQILPLSKVKELKEQLETFGIKRSWSYIPFTEDNTSNPVCVCSTGPLSGYMVQVFHDDAPKLKWRSLASLLEKMIPLVEADEWEFGGASSDFSESPRTERDITTARELLSLVRRESVSNVERSDGCSFASWLLGAEQTQEIASLLDSEDEYVRREVCDRLTALGTSEGDQALAKYEQTFQSFVKSCSDALTSAGVQNQIQTSPENGLQVLKGSMWLNMDAFFTKRREPNFNNYFLDRVTKLMEQEQQSN